MADGLKIANSKSGIFFNQLKNMFMKIKLTLIAIAVVLSAKSFAQSANENPSLSIGLEVGFPASKDFSDLYNTGFGGSAKIAIPVVTNGAVTLSAGYIS